MSSCSYQVKNIIINSFVAIYLLNAIINSIEQTDIYRPRKRHQLEIKLISAQIWKMYEILTCIFLSYFSSQESLEQPITTNDDQNAKLLAIM